MMTKLVFYRSGTDVMRDSHAESVRSVVTRLG